jgi:hypothetical protein
MGIHSAGKMGKTGKMPHHFELRKLRKGRRLAPKELSGNFYRYSLRISPGTANTLCSPARLFPKGWLHRRALYNPFLTITNIFHLRHRILL